MRPEQIKKYYKNYYRFAKATGFSAGSLINWINWGYVPIKSQFKIQELTRGDLMANWNHDKSGK